MVARDELLRGTRLFVAPIDGDDHVHARIEGVLSRYYKATKGLERLLLPGLRVPDAIPGDRPLTLRLSSSQPIVGLPTELRDP